MKPVFLLLLLHFFKCPYAQAQAAPAVPNYQQTGTIQLKNHSTFLQQKDSATTRRKRTYLIAGIHAASYAGTLLTLSTVWYADYPKAKFHLFNDSKEWLQMDKVGHAWTAYNIANYSTSLRKWSGLNKRNAALLGGLSSLGYQTILEVLDGYSSEWGWSWSDMSANAFGAALYTSQQLLWENQKVILKFSSFPHRDDVLLRERADDLFGKTFPERLLKDYNTQTYWASLNLNALSATAFPPWLSVAIGYGATGMYGGFENISYYQNGAVLFDRRDIKRVRQWYLSPDIDWTKIKTNKKAVRTLFSLLNLVKVPAPALELRAGKLKGHCIHF